jgi:integrase
MLIFPAVWDWYLQWREARRGFYTKWEVDMLSVVLSMARAETGWIRQNPDLANRLRPIPGMITQREIDRVRDDWDGSCDAFYKHARHRVREIQRVARIHRDPFEPILPVLEADSPVGEYRKITEEIMRLMPDEARYPRAAAEAVRSFLLIRLGMHTGLRQRNLRELLVCPRGRTPTSERHLEDKKRGEMRWSDRDGGWEVLIPSIAFKNSTSSFFGSKPFRLVLPDLAGLYDAIEAYIDRHRGILIGEAKDPGTFFVKSVKRTSADAAYNQNTFYEAWRLTIQRYGIFNPYTGRGAIKGLLPHGPHNVRDVLATHILKQTGSYEQASYAIQDTPAMVQQHYGRFLPQDKAAIAAKILNRVWEEV